MSNWSVVWDNFPYLLWGAYPDGPLGVIRPGAYADLLIYDGNPLEDIAVLTRPEETLKLVMKDGVIYKNELPRP